MAQTPPVWEPTPEREGLGPLTGLRDLVDRVAASSPARLAMLAFSLVVRLCTGLLSLPMATADGEPAPLHVALFTAVSAVCVTGLTVVSTPLYWSFFGQLVIFLGVFIGGLGTLTVASLLTLMVSRRLGLRSKLIALEALGHASRLGEVGQLLRVVILTSVVLEASIALTLALRFLTLDQDWWTALWHGMFYGVSSFNNAGFVLHEAGIAEFAGDLWVLVPIMVGVFVGALGFPVVLGLQQHGFRWQRWSLHIKITVLASLILWVLGAILWGWMEWDNQRTIGSMDAGEKVLNADFASIQTCSGGFNLVDQNQMESTTFLLSDALMFVGGGSASTGGGIKVTTLAIMFLAILAEARGDHDVKAFGRTIPEGAMRVAISVTAAAATWVLIGAFLLLHISGASLDRVLFEVISAFATVGLSTNLSAEVPPAGVYVLAALMFLGRLGTITLASALSVRQRTQLYHYPEERPIIG